MYPLHLQWRVVIRCVLRFLEAGRVLAEEELEFEVLRGRPDSA